METDGTRESFGSHDVNGGNEEEVSELIQERKELEEQAYIRKARFEGRNSQEEVGNVGIWSNEVGAKPIWVLEAAIVRAKIQAILLFFLCLTSYALTYLAFDPYDLGFKAHFICIGLVIATCLSMEGTLLSFYSRKWLPFSISGVALLCFLVAHFQFGLIRAKLFGAIMESSHSFYQLSSGILAVALPLFSVGVELAAGLTLFRVIEWLYSPEVRAHRKREKEMKKMIQCDFEINRRESRARIEAIDFLLRTKYGKEEERTSREKKWAVIFLLIFIFVFLLSFLAGRAFGKEYATDTVMVLDATGSTGQEELEKNKDAAAEYIKGIQPRSRLSVVAVTDRSYSRPVILLRRSTGEKPGYFGEIIEKERQEILAEFREKSKDLKAVYKNSDVLGAISLASVILGESRASRKLLIIYSDMRHVTKELDLESPDQIDPDKMLEKVESLGLVPDLEGVDVFALAVLTQKKMPAAWSALRKFYEGLFLRSGASLKKYSITREVD